MQEIPQGTIIKAREGEKAAFEAIYRAASGFVYTVALRITNNPQEAEEVTQDVFLKVYRHLAEFEFRSSFTTWLYRISVNTALNAYKRLARERSRRVDLSDTSDRQEFAVAAPEVGQDEDNERRVARLLEKLKPHQRACIALREFEGLSYQQIAEVLKVKINTVRSRLKRAREVLLRGG